MKKILLIFWVMVAVMRPVVAQVNVQDSLALVDLYNSTDGADWYNKSNWLTGPVQTWFGITVNENRVVYLSLRENNLTGNIPASIGNLSELKLLEFTENYEIGGTLPTEIGMLSKLESISIGPCKVAGNIPGSFGNLTNLYEIYLEGNQLTGAIPESLGNLSKLQSIFIGNNRLSGSIPASIGKLPELGWFSAPYNQLSGPLPSGFCDVPTMSLNNNLFTFDGLECLNTSGGSTLDDQKQLSLTNRNPLLSVYAGGTLANNTYSWYKDNAAAPYAVIAGDSTLTITEAGIYWVRVTNALLQDLVLYSDSIWIENVVPANATITNSDSLALVDFYHSTNGTNWTQYTNWFTGPANTWEGVGLTGKRVTSLMLESANLTGTLPESIGNLTELRYLYLNENNIGGALPASLWDLHHLVTMSLYFNQFSGTIPASIGNLQAIEQIDLSVNQLEGGIPAELGNATNLSSLLLVRNKLTGEIPASLGNLNLSELHLSYNQLTGGLPASFANFNDFTVIYLDHNYLTGPVPSELCATKDKVAWALHDNQFTFDGLECLTYYEMLVNQKHLTITNNNPVLSVYAGGTLSNNTYTWYKDNGAAPFAVISGDSTITLTQPGTYWAKVNNSVLEQLTLYTDTVIISSIPNQDPLEFTAQKCGRDVCMSWFAQQDLKPTISHFEVERSSDNHRFRKIDRVKASRKSGRQRYSSKDYSPVWGDNYYRVKQVNKDGSHVYSKVIMMEIPRPVIVYIWPNPADNYIYFKGVDKAKKVTLYSLNGQTIRQWQNVNAYQPLNISSVRKGLYVVKVVHTSGEAVQLIIIK